MTPGILCEPPLNGLNECKVDRHLEAQTEDYFLLGPHPNAVN